MICEWSSHIPNKNLQSFFLRLSVIEFLDEYRVDVEISSTTLNAAEVSTEVILNLTHSIRN